MSSWWEEAARHTSSPSARTAASCGLSAQCRVFNHGLCRASFEELVLDNNRKLRWQRLDNLLAESRKSQGFDPAQLWALADWLLSEAPAYVRKSLADEVARLLDAAVAGDPCPRL